MKSLKQKTKRTLSSAALLSASILAILLLNLVVGAAANKFPLRFDLTENKLYALTEETKTLLSSLEEDVSLYYFASPGQENAQITQTLDMYRTASSKLKIMQNNPSTDPISTRRFTDKGISISQNTLVLERGSRYKAIQPTEIYDDYTTQAGGAFQNAFFGLEQKITRAIAYVASNETKQVCFTIGHNEADYSSVLRVLEEENIETYQVDLKTETIPDEIASLYILSPSSDFTEEEILRLDAFLSKGRGVHICFDARKKSLPRLEKYLQEFWGVTLYPDLVFEGDSSRTLNYTYMFLPDLGTHAITQNLQAGNQGVVYMYARSLELSDAEGVTDASVLAATTESGFSVHGTDRNQEGYIREGVLPLSVALTKKPMDGSVESRMVVSGSYQIYDSSFLEEGALDNRTLLYETTNFINKSDANAISISPKSLLLRTVLIGDGLTRFYIFLICILPPLVLFVLGFITYRRRRHL